MRGSTGSVPLSFAVSSRRTSNDDTLKDTGITTNAYTPYIVPLPSMDSFIYNIADKETIVKDVHKSSTYAT